jgi:hypothetical protein
VPTREFVADLYRNRAAVLLERHRAGLVEATACVVLLYWKPDHKPVIQRLAEQLDGPG